MFTPQLKMILSAIAGCTVALLAVWALNHQIVQPALRWRITTALKKRFRLNCGNWASI